MTLNNGSEVLSLDDLRTYGPSIFATEKHHKRSDRYAYIPTITPLAALMDEGFCPMRVMQSRTRDEDRRSFTNHMIRLRRSEDVERAAVVGESVMEIILRNSHDGTSAYSLNMGIFRFVCANGMVVGDSTMEVKVQHRGDEKVQVHNVIEAAYEVTGHFDKVQEKRELMQLTHLTEPTKFAFADAALAIKYGDKEPPLSVLEALNPRRFDDRGDSVWKVFNCLQENLLKGGIKPGKSKTRTTRAVTNINEDIRLNKALWSLAVSIADQA